MNDNLQHHGIKGQKWGVRRFQKKDGSLTPEGKKRYDDKNDKQEGEYKYSKGTRAAAVLLRTALMDMVITNVSAKLVLNGQEEVGKALGVIGGLYSGATMVMDLVDIVKGK